MLSTGAGDRISLPRQLTSFVGRERSRIVQCFEHLQGALDVRSCLYQVLRQGRHVAARSAT